MTDWRTHSTPAEAKRLDEIEASLNALVPLYRERRKLYDRARKRMERAKTELKP